MRNCLTLITIAVVLVVVPSGLFAQVVAIRKAAPNQFLLNEQQFNSWIMNGTGRSESPEAYLESQLTLKISQLSTQMDISDEQKARLRLAGSGDIARFHRRVEVLRNELVGQSFDHNAIQEPYQKIQPFAQEMQAGVFNEKSLLEKVMRSTISTENLERYEAYLAERWRRRYRATVKTQIATLQKSIPMTSSQREELLKMLDIPPQRNQARHAYLQMYVYYRLNQLSAEQLQSVFDQPQTDALKRFGAQYANIEATLRAQGLLP